MYTVIPGYPTASESHISSYTLFPGISTLIADDFDSRLFLTIQNTNSRVFIKLGDNASLTDFSYILPKNGVLELKYAGIVTAVVESESSTLTVTEGF